MGRTLDAIWTDIENWVASTPESELAELLRPPADSSRVTELEKQLASRLPADFVESLSVHDGTIDHDTSLFHGWLLPLADIGQQRQKLNVIADDLARSDAVMKRPGSLRPTRVIGPIKDEFWDEAWLPILLRDGTKICLDLAPLPSGQYGQVIEVDWEGKQVRLAAASFCDFLESLLTDARAEESAEREEPD